MSTLRKRAWSSVGTKIINGATGLGLFLFVAIHLVGNLTLLVGSDAFNGYAHFLEHLLHGSFIYIAEAGLILVFLFHIASAVSVWWSKKRSRPVAYASDKGAGGPSKMTLASKTMIVSGAVILLFIVYHIKHFKYGTVYTTEVHGTEMRDLYRLVVEEFSKAPMAFGYTAVMVLLGMHLRHGFWSAFQSLGLNRASVTPALFTTALVVALLLAVGFIMIPMLIYFDPFNMYPDFSSAGGAL
ncbi:MAG: succinate dehydrogenase cytochrome b subunit [Verrucomicrobia bacterium]|nr:succinate dehydrogenase cytochrome b subunit [Verrucomicrobiota bacterium]